MPQPPPGPAGRQHARAHDVRTHGAGTKRFNHPVAGELAPAYEELAITAEPGLILMIYTAEPGSPTAERLRLLASWASPRPADRTFTSTEVVYGVTGTGETEVPEYGVSP